MGTSNLRPPPRSRGCAACRQGGMLTLVLAAGVGITVALMSQLRPGGTALVYTVAQVRAALTRSPGTLAGSIVRVRGVLCRAVTVPALERGHALALVQTWRVVGSAGPVPCAVLGGPCAAPTSLWGPGAVITPGVRVVVAPATPLVAAIRRLPLVAALWPGQALHVGSSATYRVQVQRTPGRVAGVTLLVLDPALPHPELLPALVLTEGGMRR